VVMGRLMAAGSLASGRYRAALVAVIVLDITALFLGLVVVGDVSFALFVVSMAIPLGLGIASIRGHRLALYGLIAWTLVGALTQLTSRPLTERLSVLVIEVAAVALSIACLRGLPPRASSGGGAPH
jgi:hypothetical protein